MIQETILLASGCGLRYNSDGTQYVDTGVNLRTWQNEAGGAYVSAIEMDFTPLDAPGDTADFWACSHGNGCNEMTDEPLGLLLIVSGQRTAFLRTVGPRAPVA